MIVISQLSNKFWENTKYQQYQTLNAFSKHRSVKPIFIFPGSIPRPTHQERKTSNQVYKGQKCQKFLTQNIVVFAFEPIWPTF